MKRLKLSDLRLVRKENQLSRNSTSVRGEYVIPQEECHDTQFCGNK